MSDPIVRQHQVQFLGRRIVYSDGQFLQLECLPSHFSVPFLNDFARNLAESKISEVYLFTPNEQVDANRLSYLLSTYGIILKTLALQPILDLDFNHYLRLHAHLRRSLKTKSICLVFPSSSEETMLAFGACLVLDSKDHTSTPQEALQLLAAGYELKSRADIVHQFMSFLDPSYHSVSASNVVGTTPALDVQKTNPISAAAHAIDSEIIPEQTAAEKFRMSRWTIRAKLLTIVSSIILISLTGIILLATSFFKSSSETLIQEYNLSFARLTGEHIANQLKDAAFRMKDFHQKHMANRLEAPAHADVLFQDIPGTILLATASEANGDIHYDSTFFHGSLADPEANLRTKVESAMLRQKADLLQTPLNEARIININLDSSRSITAIVIRSEQQYNRLVMLCLDPSFLTAAFQSTRQSRISRLYLLNSKAIVVALSDPEQLEPNSSMAEVPIVRRMLQSGSDNGSQKYTFRGIEYLGSYQTLDFAGLGIVSTVEADKVFEAVYRIQRQNMLITVILVTISFLVVFFFSKTLTVPLVKLVQETLHVEKGNFNVNLVPTTRDEVGLLTSSFRKMAVGLKERELIKNTFGKFVNPEVAERALHGELRLGGERKECAVIFADLRNFTMMSEKMQPEEIVGYLNEYFTEMVECIYLTHGIVDKFIGDAIMAHWGALYTDGQDTRNAVNAALMMRSALQEFNRRSSGTLRPQFFFGCGINTGPVIAGQIGSEKKLEYTIIGDTVNFASRIEYMNKQFGTDILLSAHSYEIVKEHFDAVPLGPVEIRGKANAQTLYAVLGWHSDPQRPRDLESLRRVLGLPEHYSRFTTE